MSKFIIATVLLLANLFVTANAFNSITIANNSKFPAVVVELTTEKSLVLEDEKLIRYKLRHNYSLNCGGVTYGAINYTVTDMYQTTMHLLSGQRIIVEKHCSVERGQPTKSYYLKSTE